MHKAHFADLPFGDDAACVQWILLDEMEWVTLVPSVHNKKDLFWVLNNGELGRVRLVGLEVWGFTSEENFLGFYLIGDGLEMLLEDGGTGIVVDFASVLLRGDLVFHHEVAGRNLRMLLE